MLGIRKYNKVQIDCHQGDLTRFACDAMVNAANEGLVGGGGVDGAIHAAGGPGILEECRKIGHCPTGEAVVTGAYRLPAKWLIHTVGPVWRGGVAGEPEELRRCVLSVLTAAARLGARHVAVPAISTGAFGYPEGSAAYILMKAVRDFIEAGGAGAVRRVTFVLLQSETYETFRSAMAEVFPEPEAD